MREFIRTFKKLDFIFIMLMIIGMSIGMEHEVMAEYREFVYTFEDIDDIDGRQENILKKFGTYEIK